MNIAIRAAIVALSIASIGTAYADSSGGTNSQHLLQPTSRCGRETASAERPRRRDGPGWGACLRHPIEAWHVASRIIPWR